MITSLTIQNFGLIDKLALELSEGLNILTGETGAGKSILIDALRYALGERIDSAQIRNTEIPCIVEAAFDLSKKELRTNNIFAEYITKDDPSLIINRAYTPDGKNKIKINGFSVTLTQLKEIGNNLVDFHGANDHQMLLSSDSHIGILDRLCDIDSIKKSYGEKYALYTELLHKLNELKASTETRDRDIDLLSHQIKELEQAPLEPEKYEEIIQKQTMLNNSEKLFECVNELVQIFENEKTGITESLRQAFAPMKTLNGIDEKTAEFAGRLNNLKESSDSLLSDLQGYLSNITFDADEAKEINRLSDAYYDIKRKYGPAISDAQKFYKTIKEKYDFLVNLENNDSELQQKINNSKKELTDIAQKITKERKKTSAELEKTIEKELKDLGITHVKFECRIEKTELNKNGHDNITFYISPNAGEELKPLSEIVSSGEAARVMLALKKALTKVDPIPVLIFDEIDAQIGGRLGTITGQKLRELSRNRQVILITHLPQIASFADTHFKVAKKVEKNHTLTTVNMLDKDSRIKEIAKMMSGEKESSISVTHANEMLAKAKTI
jgi:DNA repair protein RecN (Recombination protein N)